MKDKPLNQNMEKGYELEFTKRKKKKQMSNDYKKICLTSEVNKEKMEQLDILHHIPGKQ